MLEAIMVLLFLILGSTLAETAPHPIIDIVGLLKINFITSNFDDC